MAQTDLSRADTRRKWAYFAALLSVALMLGPALAHLFALPNKLLLDRDAYMTAQSVYHGWAMLGFIVAAALVSTLALTVLLVGRRQALFWAAISFLCLVAAHALFWLFTYPANQTTTNWTTAPADWERLRLQWEFSHAAAAAFDVAAMVTLILSVLSWRTTAPLPQPRRLEVSRRAGLSAMDSQMH